MVSHNISCQICRWPPVVKVHHLIKILIFQSSLQRSRVCDWLTAFTRIYSRIKVQGNNSTERSECSHQLHLVFPGRARPSIQIKKPVTGAVPKRIVRTCASLYGCSYKTGEQEHMISPDLCLLGLRKTTRSVLLFITILVELNNVQPLIFFRHKAQFDSKPNLSVITEEAKRLQDNMILPLHFNSEIWLIHLTNLQWRAFLNWSLVWPFDFPLVVMKPGRYCCKFL